MILCPLSATEGRYVPLFPRPPQALTPGYKELVNLMEGLTNDEVTTYQEANPDFIALFEIDVGELLLAPAETPTQPVLPDDTKLPSWEAVAKLELATNAI